MRLCPVYWTETRAETRNALVVPHSALTRLKDDVSDDARLVVKQHLGL